MRVETSVKSSVTGGRAVASKAAGLLIASALLAACGGPADDTAASSPTVDDGALGVAEAGRPAQVPSGFVATPHGYFHPSCVVELGDDERVGDSGEVVRQGAERRALAPCRHSRYDKVGRLVVKKDAAANTPPPTVNGWVASISSTSVGPVKSISATWNVPRAPKVAGAQTLYFFPGLEPSATGDAILQPVLAWNGFNDGRWTIASWNCCKDANALHSAPKAVSPGETITGSVVGSSCNAQGVCASWKIRTASSRGVSTTLNTTAHGEVLDWEFAGAFEAYGVDSCNQYPSDGRVAFTSVAVRQTSGAVTTPAWVAMNYGTSPGCLTSVTSDPGGRNASLAWVTQ
jgi:hypothetical protein